MWFKDLIILKRFIVNSLNLPFLLLKFPSYVILFFSCPSCHLLCKANKYVYAAFSFFMNIAHYIHYSDP